MTMERLINWLALCNSSQPLPLDFASTFPFVPGAASLDKAGFCTYLDNEVEGYLIQDIMRSVSFQGSTGFVDLDSSGERIGAFYSIVNWQNGRYTEAGVASADTLVDLPALAQQGLLLFVGNTTSPPPDMVPLYIACSEVGCGTNSFCENGDLCVCNVGEFEIKDSRYFTGVNFACVPTSASTSEQQVFWTLSFFISSFSLISTISVLLTYFYNEKLWEPLSLSFLGVMIPDFVLTITLFCSQLANLLRGSHLEGWECQVAGVVTYASVFATFGGPIVVGGITAVKLRKLNRGRLSDPVRGWVVGIFLAFSLGSGSRAGACCLFTRTHWFFSRHLLLYDDMGRGHVRGIDNFLSDFLLHRYPDSVLIHVFPFTPA